MKIAIASDDGKSISQHFGRAPFYVVVAAEDGKVKAKETRPKAEHHAHGGHGHTPIGEPHGFDAPAQATHTSTVSNISDCQIVIAGGMGRRVYESLKAHNIQPIITDVKEIDHAVQLHLQGRLPNLTHRLH